MQFPNHLYLVNLILRRKIVISESLITIGDESINSNTGYKGGPFVLFKKNKKESYMAYLCYAHKWFTNRKD